MKLSTKLLIGLLGTMLVMMLISAFSIKSEFEKINQKDPYWNFQTLSEKPFKHLKVIGQKDATGKVNILENKNFAVNVAKNRASEVKISFSNDTLIVSFFKNALKETATIYDSYENFVTILCPEINSVKGETTFIRLDSLNQNQLTIEANKITTVDINRTQIPNLNIRLDKNSECEFRYDRSYNLENLEANVAVGAILKMRYVYPKKFILNTTEKSVVEMNGTALNLLRK